MATFSALWALAHVARGAMAPPGPLGSASGVVQRLFAAIRPYGHDHLPCLACSDVSHMTLVPQYQRKMPPRCFVYLHVVCIRQACQGVYAGDLPIVCRNIPRFFTCMTQARRDGNNILVGIITIASEQSSHVTVSQVTLTTAGWSGSLDPLASATPQGL